MRRSHVIALAMGTACALVVAAFVVDPALAGQGAAGIAGSGGGSGSGSQAGSNLGNMLRGIAQPLMLGIAAIMGVGAIVRRDFGFAMGLFAILVVVGGFVVAPDSLLGFVKHVWSTILQGAVIEFRWFT